MLPHRQRPPVRMLGRSSEAADHPFRAMPPDEASRPVRETAIRGNDVGSQPARVRRNQKAPPFAASAQGVALVTVHKTGGRIEAAAVSPAARGLGLRPGMALTRIRASVPETIIRDADPQGDAADLDRLAVLIARRWTPLVAKSDADGLLLDLTGVAHLHGGEAAMARRLIRLLARKGFAARIGIADTAGAAWALARFAAEPLAICPPGAEAATLATLPAAGLRLPEPVLALFQRLGIETIGDVMAQPRAPFARRFGAEAARRLDQALGRAGEPLDPVVPPETIHIVERFAEPIGSADVIAHWLGALVPRLTEKLTQAGQGALALMLVADRIDGQPQPIRVGFARPNRDPAHILRLIVRRIEEIDPGFGIDALHLHVRRAEPLSAQPFDRNLEDNTPDLASLVDVLANRSVAAWRETPIESDVPERSLARVPALDAQKPVRARVRSDDVRQLDRRAAEHPWHPRRPRPVRILRHPERIDHVIAELPDQPPKRFTWRGRRHIVVRADGPERIAGEWWKNPTEREAVRDYFTVEDEAGQRFWLFRRGDGERAQTGDLSWYLHGRFG